MNAISNLLLDGMNGTGLAVLHQALNKARLEADSANFYSITQMIEAVEEAGIRNCGKDEFAAHVKELARI